MLRLRQLVGGNQETDSILGDLVRETYRFIHEGAKKDHIVFDPKNAYEPTKAIGCFLVYGRDNKNFAIRQERLPEDPHTKAVLYHRGRVQIETGKVDFDIWRKFLQKEGINLPEKRRHIDFGDQTIIRTLTQNVDPRGPYDIRTLIGIMPKYQSPEWETALRAIDILDEEGCFIPNRTLDSEYTDFSSLAPVEIRIRLEQRPEMRQQLQQQLRQIQRPRLLPITEQVWRIAQRAHQATILKMSGDQLAEHIQEQINQNPCLEEDKTI